MSKFSIPNFAELDVNSLKEYYNVQIDFKGHKIEMDLNFIEKTIEADKLEMVKTFIDNLKMLNTVALDAIKEDFLKGGPVKEYIEQQLEETSEKNLSFFVQQSKKPAAKENKMLAKFYLKRVGFYPQNEDQFAVFDFTIGEELTDYIIAVNFKEDGEIAYLSMEN